MHVLKDIPVEKWDALVSVGRTQAIIANRISYVLDAHGPSMVVDTACSSSLVAVHLACAGLAAGETDLALAGGVRILLRPELYTSMSKSGMLSPDGRCKAFDAAANGFVRSEGAGFVVLKRLADAVADEDDIYAVILGSATNVDGRGGGLTVPNGTAQAMVLREAYERAGVRPEAVQFVEAHGTGTPLGDPIEVEALAKVVGVNRPPGTWCALGSSKTNLGHLEPASGIAGLIKTALAIKHRLLPPNLHFREPNPRIPFADLPLRVQTELTPWPPSDRLLAGVSAFGIGGVNCHAVLTDHPPTTHPPFGMGRLQLLPIYARTAESLRSLARSFSEFLGPHGAGATLSLADVAYSASVRRTGHACRFAVVARTCAEAARALSELAQAPTGPTVREPTGSSKIAFVFSGQGQQWWGMGRQLLEEEPVFRGVMEPCDALIRSHAGWSLLEELSVDESRSRLGETEIAQPAIVALQIALAALWNSWGIAPDAVTGHSVGEISAAHVAGVLGLEEALRLTIERGRVMQRATGRGRMLSVELSGEEASRLLVGYEDRVTVAAENSPSSVVLAGDVATVTALERELSQKGVVARTLRVSYAFHSPQMDDCVPDLAQRVAWIRPRSARRTLVSTALGASCAGEAMDSAYWGRQLREPVKFRSAIAALVADGVRSFVELAAHPVLYGSISDSVGPELAAKTVVVSSLKRQEDERKVMLQALAALHTRGHGVRWDGLHPTPGRHVRLPPHPWEHHRHWPVPGEAKSTGGWSAARRPSHPLLGRPLVLADHYVWETDVDRETFRWIEDHRIEGVPVLPGMTYVEMAHAAALEALGGRLCHVVDVEFKSVFVLSDDPRVAQAVLVPEGDDGAAFRVYSRSARGDADRPWVLHATATIRFAEPEPRSSLDLVELRSRLWTEMTGTAFYESAPFGYGERFRALDHLWIGEDEVLCRMVVPELVARDLGYRIHPAVWDACIQPGIALRERSAPTYLPVGLQEIRLHGRAEGVMWCHARRRTSRRDGQSFLDCTLLRETGEIIAELGGFQSRVVDTGAAAKTDDVSSWLYDVAWGSPADRGRGSPESGVWLILGAASDDLVRQLDAALKASGAVTVRASTTTDAPDVAQVVAEVAAKHDGGLRGVVHVYPALADVESAQRALGGALRIVQALSRTGAPPVPRLWFVTSGAQAIRPGEPCSPFHGALWGFGRVVSAEHDELRCMLVDVEREPTAMSILAVADEMRAPGVEGQLAFRDGQIVVPRLRHHVPPPLAPIAASAAFDEPCPPFRLEWGRGKHHERVILTGAPRKALDPNEVEIRVHYAHIDRRDALRAKRAAAGRDDGREGFGVACAGTIVGIGAEVTDRHVGEEVVAYCAAPEIGAAAAFVTVAACFVARRPRALPWDASAAVPGAFVAAYHCLREVARLRPGERVVLDDASSGVGLAATQVALRLGAEIVEEAHAAADDRDVDVILGSGADRAASKLLGLLRVCGRLVELRAAEGRDPRPVAPKSNVTHVSVDLAELTRERPEYVASLFAEVVRELDEGTLRPFPVRSALVSDSDALVRALARGKEPGEVVVPLRDPDALFVPLPTGPGIVADATYLVTGGLGGLGLAVADWLVARGARSLLLLGRSGPSASATASIRSLESRGARVRVMSADVADPTHLRRVFTALDDMPPLRGIIHAAGALEDALVAQFDEERFMRPLPAKLAGAWHLHELTKERSLDLFVLFSSVSAVLGSVGQANYAAGNAFLDSLAARRRAEGLPAISIAWGPWREVGMAAQEDRAQRLAQGGMLGLTTEGALRALERALATDVAHLGVMAVDWPTWLRAHPERARWRFFQAFGGQGAARGASEDRTQELDVESYLFDQAAAVLGVERSDIRPEHHLIELGANSIVTVELRNRIGAELGVMIPVVELLDPSATLAVLAAKIQRLRATTDDGARNDDAPPAAPTEIARPPEPVATSGDGVTEPVDEEDLDATLAALLRDQQDRS
jgi:acyl transferase domain-containing protein/acyl carrier protein